MRSPLGRLTPAAALALGIGVLASATAVYAAGLEPDGVHLRASFPGGGEAWLELEDRNARPALCFLWDHPAPQDGDSFASRILTRGGAVVVDLGSADQWVDGVGQGCEIPTDDRFRDVLARPGDFVVELDVVEDQGTPVTPTLRSAPLRAATG